MCHNTKNILYFFRAIMKIWNIWSPWLGVLFPAWSSRLDLRIRPPLVDLKITRLNITIFNWSITGQRDGDIFQTHLADALAEDSRQKVLAERVLHPLQKVFRRVGWWTAFFIEDNFYWLFEYQDSVSFQVTISQNTNSLLRLKNFESQ